MPYESAIPFLGIYPEKTLIQKDTCTPIFIAALFTIAKTWKQPKNPPTDERIKMCSVWEYMCLCLEYYSAIEKNEILPFAATQGPRDYHTKWSKSDRET